MINAYNTVIILSSSVRYSNGGSDCPTFKNMVKLAITPMLASLSLLNHTDMNSEAVVLGYGIGIIMVNAGMYFIMPAVVIWQIRKMIKI